MRISLKLIRIVISEWTFIDFYLTSIIIYTLFENCFTLKALFIVTYADIDECVFGINDCDPVSTECVNNHGSFTCDCKNGFIPDQQLVQVSSCS